MYADAGKELADAVYDSIRLLLSHLKTDSNNFADKNEKDFNKMLDVARDTPKPERGPAKVKLQREVQLKLGEYKLLLRKSLIETETPIAVDDSMNDRDENEDDDTDIEYNSNASAYESNLDDVNGVEDLGSNTASLNDTDSEAECLLVSDNDD